MTVKVTIPEDSRQRLENVLRDTMLFRGRNPERLVMKAAGYVASFAYAKIPVAASAKIMELLRTQVTLSSKLYRRNRSGRRVRVRRTKVASEWTGTLAAVLVATVASWGYKSKRGRRAMKGIFSKLGGFGDRKNTQPSAFYRAVAAYARSKASSSGYIRSGLIPAIKIFRGSKYGITGGARKEVGKWKVPPGSAEFRANANRITALMEDYSVGIDKVAPHALRVAEREVAVQFDKWLLQAHEEAAQKTGQLTRA